MPAKSKAQLRFMRAIAHGWKKPGGGGPSKSQAKEYVAGQSDKGLPETVKSDTIIPGNDKRAIRAPKTDSKAGKPKMSANTLTPDRMKEIARKQGVERKIVKKDPGQKIIENLLKAFERLDNYTLVDPREYYGALGTINNEVMKWLAPLKEMKVDDSKTVSLPVKGARLKVRKVMGDMFSGWLTDKEGGINHLFDRLSLPVLASQIMSVYEVYDKKENPELLSLKDEIERLNGELKGAKAGGEEAKNVGERLKTIIESIDKLTAAHDSLVSRTEKEFKNIEEKQKEDQKALSLSNIHSKLSALKDVLPVQEEAPTMPDTIAVRRVGEPGKCEDCGCNPCKCYVHLSRPTIEVTPEGKVTVMFKSDWQNMDKSNFLTSMKLVVDRKRK